MRAPISSMAANPCGGFLGAKMSTLLLRLWGKRAKKIDPERLENPREREFEVLYNLFLPLVIPQGPQDGVYLLGMVLFWVSFMIPATELREEGERVLVSLGGFFVLFLAVGRKS